MNVFVVNCGSSSLKYQLIDSLTEQVIAKGLCERIGIDGRLTHKPTGIVVSCQVERSQHQNREVAMTMLKSKLIEIKEREHLAKIEDIKGDHKEIAWGSQIRSYVFHPYNLVKDHRTSFEMGNIGAVMDGDINGFINAYLKAARLGQLELK